MANKIYVNPGTPTSFKASGGDIVLTLDNISTAAGRISAKWDRGAAAQPADYEVQATVQANATVTVGNTCTFFYAGSMDDTTYDGTIPNSGDAALSSVDLRRNLRPLVSVAADQTAATVNMTASQTVRITSRYVVVVFYNELGATTKNSANASFLKLTPVPAEIQ